MIAREGVGRAAAPAMPRADLAHEALGQVQRLAAAQAQRRCQSDELNNVKSSGAAFGRRQLLLTPTQRLCECFLRYVQRLTAFSKRIDQRSVLRSVDGLLHRRRGLNGAMTVGSQTRLPENLVESSRGDCYACLFSSDVRPG